MDLTESDLDKAHRPGLKVVVWGWPKEEGTEFNYAQIENMIDFGVDGIITDRPDILRGILVSRGLNLPRGFEKKEQLSRTDRQIHRGVRRTRGQPCDFEGEAFDKRVPPLLNMRPALLLTGPECVKVGMNRLAPTENKTYFMTARLPLPENLVYAPVRRPGHPDRQRHLRGPGPEFQPHPVRV